MVTDFKLPVQNDTQPYTRWLVIRVGRSEENDPGLKSRRNFAGSRPEPTRASRAILSAVRNCGQFPNKSARHKKMLLWLNPMAACA
jgi:hypothetical protein